MRALVLFAAAIAAAGALLRLWGAAWLSTDIVHDMRLRSERVVADGPYRFVRNPLYLGLWLLGVGIAVMASSIGAIWVLVALAVFLQRLVGREEHELHAAQGESFARYCAAVPRLWPALRPRLPASGRAPAWRAAVLGEAFSFLFVAAIAVFAFTFDVGLAGMICLGSALLVPILQGLQRARSAQSRT